jgi:hypothetical protein
MTDGLGSTVPHSTAQRWRRWDWHSTNILIPFEFPFSGLVYGLRRIFGSAAIHTLGGLGIIGF